MTEIDETPSGHFIREAAARELLGDTSEFPPGSLIANYVGVAQVLRPDGSLRIVRVYPFGAMSGSLERGMLGDALSDSHYDRDRRRRST